MNQIFYFLLQILIQVLNNGVGGDDNGDSNDIFCGSFALYALSLIVTMTLVFAYDYLHFRGEIKCLAKGHIANK